MNDNKIIEDILRFLFLNNISGVSESRIKQLLDSYKHLNYSEKIISIVELFGFKSKTVDIEISEISEINANSFFIQGCKGDFLLLVDSDVNPTFFKNIEICEQFKIEEINNKRIIKCIFFEKNRLKKSNSLLNVIIDYFLPYRKFFYQVLYGVIVITLLQFVSPFLMQLLIDKGIVVEDISLIKAVVIGLIVVQLSRFFAEFIRGWLYLHIGIRINVSMISDFITNVMGLPIHYFNSNTIGDILQRVDDNKRIESFLTRSVINFIFNIVTLLIFLFILGIFSMKVFAIFIIGNVLFILWTLLFWRIRKKMDMNIFKLNAKNQNILIQLLQSIQEIKLYNLDKEKRWDWEDNQVDLFKNKQKMLLIEQLQEGVSLFINESKNYIILYISAISIIDGSMSFGTMIAIQYILGQTNLPIKGITNFIMEYQMALISFQRINEINILLKNNSSIQETDIINEISDSGEIELRNVTFQYQDSKRTFSLRNVNMKFEKGKTTAIIGKSGSGKTTVLKLILKFYNPYKGDVFFDGLNLRTINAKAWRDKCGAILQDSMIFNDSILNNITMGKTYDFNKLIKIARMTDILEFVENSQNGFNTILNYSGRGLSQGQIQRLLIARLMYKDPDVVLLDEFTSSLDSITEKLIIDNLIEYFKNKTVIIISHKMSTVKHADRFIIMNDGKILEHGNHDYLMEKNGYYASIMSAK